MRSLGVGSSETNPAATPLSTVPWRRGNFTSLLRTPRSAGVRLARRETGEENAGNPDLAGNEGWVGEVKT